jgi:hypothetical protein
LWLSTFSFKFVLSPYKSHEKWGIKLSPAEAHVGGRYTYDGVLSSALKGLFVTLLSCSQYNAVLRMIPGTLPPLRDKNAYGFWRGTVSLKAVTYF